jgi:hypothetical protein
VLLSLACKYYLLVFIAVLGVLQGAAACNRRHGLAFFRYRPLSYAFAALAVGFSLFIFFNWNYRYETGIIQGTQQAGLFALGAVTALIYTLIVSSAIKRVSFKRRPAYLRRLKALWHTTMYHIIREKVNGRR